MTGNAIGTHKFWSQVIQIDGSSSNQNNPGKHFCLVECLQQVTPNLTTEANHKCRGILLTKSVNVLLSTVCNSWKEKKNFIHSLYTCKIPVYLWCLGIRATILHNRFFKDLNQMKRMTKK